MSVQLIHEETQARTTEPTAAAGRGRLRGVWHRIRRSVQEMNYSAQISFATAWRCREDDNWVSSCW
jgi:hypothetical protein